MKGDIRLNAVTRGYCTDHLEHPMARVQDWTGLNLPVNDKS